MGVALSYFCSVLATLAGLCLAGSTASAQTAPPSSPPTSDAAFAPLRAILVNLHEFRGLSMRYKQDPLYFEREYWRMTASRSGQRYDLWKPKGLRKTECDFSRDGCLLVGFIAARLEFSGYRSDHVVSLRDYVSEAFGESVMKELDREGYFSPEHRFGLDAAALRAAFDHLETTSRTADDWARFREELFLHPRAFRLLPEFQARWAQAPHRDRTALLTLTTDALEAMLRLLVPVSEDPRIYTYWDDIVGPHTLLHVDALRERLSQPPGRGYPITLELDRPERDRRGCLLNQPSPGRPGTYRALGAFDADDNAILMDPTLPFFENLYIRLHELAHAAWHASPQGETSRGLVRARVTDAKALPSEFARHILTRELFGIDQQIRLYHAVSWLTSQWDMPQASTDAWARRYFGNDYDKIRRKNRKDLPLKNGEKRMKFQRFGMPLAFGIPFEFVVEGAALLDHLGPKLKRLFFSLEEYFAQTAEVHLREFKKRYLKIEPAPIDLKTVMRSYQDPEAWPVIVPEAIATGGESIRALRLAAGVALGCDPGGVGPGTDGVHGDLDDIADFLDAFPAMDGLEEAP